MTEKKLTIDNFEAQAFHMEPAPSGYENMIEWKLRCIEELLNNILKRTVKIEQLLEKE